MSKAKRVSNCNALIELMCMAKTERSRKFYKTMLFRQACYLTKMKNDPLG